MLVKIGMELPFTSKNKHRNTILKFDFLKVPFCTPEKTHFWSLKKTAPKKFSFCFGFDSALKTINAQMFLWLAFLKTHKKKVIECQKRHFGRFWWLIMVFDVKNILKMFFIVSLQFSLLNKLKNIFCIRWSETLKNLKKNIFCVLF